MIFSIFNCINNFFYFLDNNISYFKKKIVHFSLLSENDISVVVDFFKQINIKVNHIIPNRFEHNYGLSKEAIDDVLKKYTKDKDYKEDRNREFSKLLQVQCF